MRGLFLCETALWEMSHWPPIGGWLPIRVAASSTVMC